MIHIWFQAVFSYFQTACQNQLFFRSCHRYIKHTEFFCKILKLCLLLDHFLQKGRCLCPHLKVYNVNSNSVSRMDHNTSFQILCIELLSCSGYKNDWKLQTFTFMNTHNTDCVILFVYDTCFAIINIIFFQLLDIAYEIKQTFITRPFKCSCFLNKHFYISLSLCAPWHRTDK